MKVDRSADKAMVWIVRIAGGIALLLAAGGVLDVALFLWRQHGDTTDTAGIGNKVVLICILAGIGLGLCLFSPRIGPWLVSDGKLRATRTSKTETLQ